MSQHRTVDGVDESSAPDGTAAGPSESNRETPGQESGLEDVPIGVIYDILRNERRRRVLEHLDGRDDEVALGELAERLAATENDKPEAQLTSQERKRVYVGLYQSHLPRMDDAGAVEFDGDRGLIRSTELTASFVEHLPSTTTESTTRPWPSYYLALAAVATLLFTGDLAGLLPFAGSTSLIFAGVVIAMAALAVVHAAAVRGTEPD